MNLTALQQKFDDLILTDPRPIAQRDRYQARHGRKRSNIESVRVIRAPSAIPTGAAPTLFNKSFKPPSRTPAPPRWAPLSPAP